MDIEKAKDFLEEKIKVNNAVRKEAIKSGDTNAIELTDALDTETSAIETVLQALENIEVSDTNVGNIEKDINRCKELIKDKHKEWIGMTNQKAIENVLKKYEIV